MPHEINYTQTTWVNEETRLNAQNMNNIDRGIVSLIGALDDMPTKTSQLTNDSGFITSADISHTSSYSYSGGASTDRQITFGFAPSYVVIEDYAQGETTPTTTTLNSDYSDSGTTITFEDWGISIESEPEAPFNETGHTYKILGYAFPPATLVDGLVMSSLDGKWVGQTPSELGFSEVKPNITPSGTPTVLSTIQIDNEDFTIVGQVEVDSSLSSSSTNPVQNKVINSALNGKEDVSHKVNTISGSSTTNYPSVKAVADAIAAIPTGTTVVANPSSVGTALTGLQVGETAYKVSNVVANPIQGGVLLLTNLTVDGTTYHIGNTTAVSNPDPLSQQLHGIQIGTVTYKVSNSNWVEQTTGSGDVFDDLNNSNIGTYKYVLTGKQMTITFSYPSTFLSTNLRAQLVDFPNVSIDTQKFGYVYNNEGDSSVSAIRVMIYESSGNIYIVTSNAGVGYITDLRKLDGATFTLLLN